MAPSSSAPPTSGSKSKKRSIWFHLHFWTGWIAALPIAVVCLTGAVLVLEQEVFRWEHPELFDLEPTRTPLSVGQVLERYRSADPPLQVNHLQMPESPSHAYRAYSIELRPEGNRGAQVFLDPYTGELTWLGDGFSLSETLVALHRNLAAGRLGRQIVAVSSLVLAVTSLFGLILWWPLRGRTFVRAWRRGHALDWHNALGLVVFVPLIVMAVTGVTFTWGNQAFSLLQRLSEQPLAVARPAVEVPEGAERIPLDAVVTEAEAILPDLRLIGIQPSNGETSPHAFLFSGGGDVQLLMDPYTGENLARIAAPGPGLLGWYRTYFGRLHTFEPYNLILRISWGLLSLGGTVLVVTGLWVSVKRWRRPKRRPV